jgi:hypothetical protein
MWRLYRSLLGPAPVRLLEDPSSHDVQMLSRSMGLESGVSKRLLVLVLTAAACIGTILAMFAWSGASL